MLFSAHYDHLGVDLPDNGDTVYNGADDDATGTVAVIALAEALSKSKAPHQRSYMFVCFSGEEKGLLGSRQFTKTPPVPLKQIVVDLNLEMLGRPASGNENCAWITGKEYSNFAEICTKSFAKVGVKTIDFAMATRLFSSSDNSPFAKKGIVAHSISASSLHQDYHQVSDELSKINLTHLTTIIRAILQAGTDFANRPEAPSYR